MSIDGPYKGSAADVTIARTTVIPQLKENEKIMTDKGYYQEKKCWTPPLGPISQMTSEQKRERRKVTRIRHLNERLIGRLTFWGIFKRRWDSSFKFHSMCANVAARLTQLEVHAFPLT